MNECWNCNEADEDYPRVCPKCGKPKDHSPDLNIEDMPEGFESVTRNLPSGTFNLSELETLKQVRRFIRECEGKHIQQIAYSSYHDSLTQICFTCKEIRTNLKISGKKIIK